MKDIVRIGAGSAFSNDSALTAPQMLAADPPDYLVFEHLSEGLMSPLAEAMARSPELGYSTNLIDFHLGPNLKALKAAGVKVVTNGGGINPAAAARALERIAREAGVSLKIAYVEGDDLRDRTEEFAARGYREMFSGAPWPAKIVSANAYLGAFPIAEALGRGADVVITGRVVDSALTLGPLIHEFGWRPDDYDQLAAGTAAGHLLECGAMATGGFSTDWLDIPAWEEIGYPIAECRADGSFVLTKPDGTGGVVNVGSVSEQLIYEIGDPAAYLVPDVTCDFRSIRLSEIGPDCIEVTGVRGRPPTDTYKVTATYADGWRMNVLFPVLAKDAAKKARRMADGYLVRAARAAAHLEAPAHRAAQTDVIGAGDLFPAGQRGSEEVVARIVTFHDDQRSAQIYAAETRCLTTNGPAGVMAMGLPTVTAVAHLFCFLLPKADVSVKFTLGGETYDWRAPDARASVAAAPVEGPTPAAACDAVTPLSRLAWTRSGDKGDLFNVGIIALRPEYYPYLVAALDEQRIAAWYAHVFNSPEKRRVRRYLLPGLNALNFVLEEALGGGQTVGLRLDANAKSMAQQLLPIEIPVPRALLDGSDERVAAA
jgi:hypothetical protein